MTIVIPGNLIDAIRRKTCIAFVGAGLSVPAGMPTWKQFILDMIMATENQTQITVGDELRGEVEDGRFLEVSEYLRNELGSYGYYQIVRRSFAVAAEPTRNHELIVEIPFRGIITTNYDKILETAYTLRRRYPPRVMTWTDASSLGPVLYDDEFFIFKLHGDVDYSESIILTRRDYDEAMYRSPHVRSFLQAVFLTNVLFFVGYSINDPDFQMAVSELTLLFRGSAPESFALLPEPDSLFGQSYRDRFNINVLPYDPVDDHREVTQVLEAIRDSQGIA